MSNEEGRPQTCNESFKRSPEGQALMDRRDELAPDEFDRQWDEGIELMHAVGACEAPSQNERTR